MIIYTFHSELWLPLPIGEVFEFFGDAHNLQAITPAWLDFKILTPAPMEMKAGVLIDYRLCIRSLPVRWQTEITAWQPPYRFVDEQKRGPYRHWIHEHCFEAEDGVTRCSDTVNYAVFGGSLVNRLFVRRDVERIFAHRTERLKILHAGSHAHAEQAKYR